MCQLNRSIFRALALFLAISLLFLALWVTHLLTTPGGTDDSNRRIKPMATRLERYTTMLLYGRPVVSLRIWGQSRRGIGRVELFSSGKLVIHCGPKTEQQLSPAEFRRLVQLAEDAAHTDFSNPGGPTVPGGTNADIEIRTQGKLFRVMRVLCRGSPDWPAGPNTRELLAEINGHLSKDAQIR